MTDHERVAIERGQFLLGSIKDVKKDFLAFMFRLFETRGRLAKFFLGKKAVYLIGEPDMIEKVMIRHKDIFVKPYDLNKPRGLALVLGKGLVTSQGDLWKRQRKMMQPIFHKSNIATMVNTISAQGEAFVASLRQTTGAEIDVSGPISSLTLEVISRTMFGKNATEFGDRLPEELAVALKYAMLNFFHPFPMPRYIPTKGNRRFDRAMKFLSSTISYIIEQRAESITSADDLLQLLLDSRDDETGQAMSSQQIVDEAITMYSAGHETTAAALIWTLYLLATHQDIQQQVAEEIQQALGENRPRYEDLEAMPLTRAVIEESMRLYPPIVLLLRRVDQNVEIDDVAFEKDAYTIVNLYNLNHDPQIWDEPEKFLPERFLGKENQSKGKPFYPFGIGHRVCIGNHFAMIEAVLLLSQIIQQFRVKYHREEVPKPQLAISLRPAHGMPLIFTERLRPETGAASEDEVSVALEI